MKSLPLQRRKDLRMVVWAILATLFVSQWFPWKLSKRKLAPDLSCPPKRNAETTSKLNETSLLFVHIPKTGGTAIEDAAQIQGISWGAPWWLAQGWSWNGCNKKKQCSESQEAEHLLKNRGVYISPWHMPTCLLDAVHQKVPSYLAPFHHPTAEATSNNNAPRSHSSFAVVRNPYHRAVSEFWWAPHHQKRETRGQMNQFIAEKLRTVEEGMLQMTKIIRRQENNNKNVSAFCDLSELDPRYVVGDGHWIPQSHFVRTMDPASVDEPRQDGKRRTTGSGCGTIQSYAELNNTRRQGIQHVLKYENLQREFADLMELYGLNVTLPPKKTKRKRKNQQRLRELLSVRNLSLKNIQAINRIYRDDFVNFGYTMK